ncbi:MAG: dUTP diphosphatase [Gammaproteobacteria bacterium]|nr:dUTP diphosphatase [Gammaproteobacteria bacterium]
MAALQRRHNEQVHPRWEKQGYEYYRAVWVECAELLDHFGWKWWKRQDSDLDQVRLEIVDIWHFGLSELLRRNEVDLALAGRLRAALTDDDSSLPDFRVAVEELARSSLASKGFDIEAFAAVMRALPMSFDELYEIYVAKNILNAFRQDHGYKTGDYIKVWNGREDNEHLSEILRELDPRAKSFATDVGRALAERYAALPGALPGKDG